MFDIAELELFALGPRLRHVVVQGTPSIRRNEVGSKISDNLAGRAMNLGQLDGLALFVDEESR